MFKSKRKNCKVKKIFLWNVKTSRYFLKFKKKKKTNNS